MPFVVGLVCTKWDKKSRWWEKIENNVRNYK